MVKRIFSATTGATTLMMTFTAPPQHPMSIVNGRQLSCTGHRGPAYIEITECRVWIGNPRLLIVKLNRNAHAGAYDEHQVVVPGVAGWHD